MKYGLQENTNVWITWGFVEPLDPELITLLDPLTCGDKSTHSVDTIREMFLQNGFVKVDGPYICNAKYVIELYFWRPRSQPSIKITSNPDNDVIKYIKRFRSYNKLMKELSEYPMPLATY